MVILPRPQVTLAISTKSKPQLPISSWLKIFMTVMAVSLTIITRIRLVFTQEFTFCQCRFKKWKNWVHMLAEGLPSDLVLLQLFQESIGFSNPTHSDQIWHTVGLMPESPLGSKPPRQTVAKIVLIEVPQTFSTMSTSKHVKEKV